jgi:hypothetical protein
MAQQYWHYTDNTKQDQLLGLHLCINNSLQSNLQIF